MVKLIQPNKNIVGIQNIRGVGAIDGKQIKRGEAVWNWAEKTYKPLGSGSPQIVTDIVYNEFDGKIYFSTAGSSGNQDTVYSWDGSNRVVEATTYGYSNSIVRGLAIDPRNGDIYAVGVYTTINGISATNLAKKSIGGIWGGVGGGVGVENSGASKLRFHNNLLYVSGGFQVVAGGTAIKSFAKWDGSSWSSVFSAIPTANRAVGDFCWDSEENCYIFGTFTVVGSGSLSALNCAKVTSGGTWSALGSGITATVKGTCRFYNEKVYFGGTFTNAGGVAGANNVAAWNGSAFEVVGGAADITDAMELYVSGGKLYCSGSKPLGGGFFRILVDNTLTDCTTGTNGPYATSLCFGNNKFFLGGSFTQWSSVTAANIIELS